MRTTRDGTVAGGQDKGKQWFEWVEVASRLSGMWLALSIVRLGAKARMGDQGWSLHVWARNRHPPRAILVASNPADGAHPIDCDPRTGRANGSLF